MARVIQRVNLDTLVREELSRWIIALLLQEPFYAHVLSGVRRLISMDCDTAAVSMRDHVITLHINPEFFMHELKNDLSGLRARYEVLHLVFKHLPSLSHDMTHSYSTSPLTSW